MSAEILYLSAADIADAAPSEDGARRAINEAFAALQHRRATSPPKQMEELSAGLSFQSRMATWEEKGFAAIKWIGVVPVPAGANQTGIHATIILNEYDTGRPLAIMEGNVLTGIRTAAMSAAAAEKLARSDVKKLGLIGCGLQARYHLKALKAALPTLNEVVAYSRSIQSAEVLAAEAKAEGWEAKAVRTPEAAVRDCDVIVSSVPAAPGLQPFLNPLWIMEGAFVSAVDIARSWQPDGLGAVDILATDSHEQQAQSPLIAPGLGPSGTLNADLAELTSGTHPGRTSETQRAMFIFRGLGLADLALASAIYHEARQRGLGTYLPV